MADDNEITQEQHDAGVVAPDATVGEDIHLDSAVDDLAASLKLADVPIDKPETADAAPQEQAPAAPAEGAPAAEPAITAPATGERAPDTWTPAAQAKWAGVDPEVRAEIQKRENDIAKFVQEVRPDLMISTEIKKSIAPFMQVMQQYGIKPFEHVNRLMAAHYNLVFSAPDVKKQMIRQLCIDVGVDPKGLTDPNAPPNQDWQMFQNELQKRDQVIARLERGVTGVTGALTDARVSELSSAIVSFGQDTEAHPFFWDLIDDVKQLITSGSARSLQEAYEMAELRNPTTRAKRLELETAKTASASQAAAAAQVGRARKATSVNVQSRGSGRRPEPEESIHDTIANKMKEIRSRSH